MVQNNTKVSADSTFEVYKIDSVGTYYLIYASRADTLFKIVSKMIKNSNCADIKVNEKYNFSLHSIWTQPIILGNINVSPSQTPHVTCLSFDSLTTICLERDKGIYDLFDCKNIRGLCYLIK
jgi:hypothetical protein